MSTAPLRVTLDADQQRRVQNVADRVAQLYRDGRVATMKYAGRGDIGEVNLNGFGAELAVAITVDQRWWEGDRKRPDVGEDIEVRQSIYDVAHLLLYPYDKAERRYVLVTGAFPSYALRGWIPGSAGMTADHHCAPGALIPFRLRPVRTAIELWAVDQAELRPIAELRAPEPEALTLWA